MSGRSKRQKKTNNSRGSEPPSRIKDLISPKKGSSLSEDRKKEKPKPEPELKSKPRVLDSLQGLQYMLALARDNLLSEKKKNIEREKEIVALKSTIAELRQKLFEKEDKEAQEKNRTLLKELGIGSNEQVVVEKGHLFIVPLDTEQPGGK